MPSEKNGLGHFSTFFAASLNRWNPGIEGITSFLRPGAVDIDGLGKDSEIWGLFFLSRKNVMMA